MIRVLLAEDSAVTRAYLAALLEEDAMLKVVGMARDGLEAIQQSARLKPDVVVMDVYMPRLNGFDAARQIMESAPRPIVMISASFNQEEAAMGFRALNAGALTIVDKPPGPEHSGHVERTRLFVETVKLMAEVKVVRRWPQQLHPISPTPMITGQRRLRLVVIGASTGGPQVIMALLAQLPATIPIPILIVQHITPGFVTGLAQWLDQSTALAVRVAHAMELLQPGTVYLAPDGMQMGLTRDGRIALTPVAGDDGFCPSISYLFASAAAIYGRETLGILLTGMGRDGARGLLQLREAGGITIAQDQNSSVVFGMPGEAIRLGAARYVLSPGAIAEMIRTSIPCV